MEKQADREELTGRFRKAIDTQAGEAMRNRVWNQGALLARWVGFCVAAVLFAGCRANTKITVHSTILRPAESPESESEKSPDVRRTPRPLVFVTQGPGEIGEGAGGASPNEGAEAGTEALQGVELGTTASPAPEPTAAPTAEPTAAPTATPAPVVNAAPSVQCDAATATGSPGSTGSFACEASDPNAGDTLQWTVSDTCPASNASFTGPAEVSFEFPSGAPCLITVSVSDGELSDSAEFEARPPLRSLTVTASGLSTAGLVVSGGVGNAVTLSDQELSKTLPIGFYEGSSFAVAVATPVSSERCVVVSPSGTVGSSNVSIDVQCTPYPAKVVVGSNHTCVLYSHGKVRCWGDNTNGQLGYGDTVSRGNSAAPENALPSAYVNLGGTVVDIGAGDRFSCALMEWGGVRCWGTSATGRLGYGRTSGSSAGVTWTNVGDNEHPSAAGDVPMATGSVFVTQLSVARQSSCVLLSDGGVKCWGGSVLGETGALGSGIENDVIGDNETPSSRAAVQLGLDATESVQKVLAAQAHSCVLTSFGRVKCWGHGAGGRLGYGNEESVGNTNHPSDVGFVNIGGLASDLYLGCASHQCVKLPAESYRCWGLGTNGRLGLGNIEGIYDPLTHTASSAPLMSLPSDAGGVKEFSTGFHLGCVLMQSGNLYCWGRQQRGRLGFGNAALLPNGVIIGDQNTELPSLLTPVPVGAPVVSMSSSVQMGSGDSHVCAIVDVSGDRRVRCWGYGANGQLGYGNTNDVGDDETPASVGDVPLPPP